MKESPTAESLQAFCETDETGAKITENLFSLCRLSPTQIDLLGLFDGVSKSEVMYPSYIQQAQANFVFQIENFAFDQIGVEATTFESLNNLWQLFENDLLVWNTAQKSFQIAPWFQSRLDALKENAPAERAQKLSDFSALLNTSMPQCLPSFFEGYIRGIITTDDACCERLNLSYQIVLQAFHEAILRGEYKKGSPFEESYYLIADYLKHANAQHAHQFKKAAQKAAQKLFRKKKTNNPQETFNQAPFIPSSVIFYRTLQKHFWRIMGLTAAVTVLLATLTILACIYYPEVAAVALLHGTLYLVTAKIALLTLAEVSMVAGFFSWLMSRKYHEIDLTCGQFAEQPTSIHDECAEYDVLNRKYPRQSYQFEDRRFADQYARVGLMAAKTETKPESEDADNSVGENASLIDDRSPLIAQKFGFG